MGILALLVLLVVAAHFISVARRLGDVPVKTVVVDLALSAALILLVSGGASLLLDYSWWKELGHAAAFWRLLEIQWLPPAAVGSAGALLLCAVFFLARRRCGTVLAASPLFTWVGAAAAALLGFLISFGAVDSWAAALWWKAGDAGAYRDPLFGRGLSFYFFKLPFYESLLGWAAALAWLGAAIYILTLLAGASSLTLFRDPQEPLRVNPPSPRILTALASAARVAGAAFLILFAAFRYVARYDLLYSTHRFLYGADFVDARVGVPLLWVQIALALILAALLLAAPRRRRRDDEVRTVAGALLGELPAWLGFTVLGGAAVGLLLPPMAESAVRGLYVRPNELTLEQPYIQNHIGATLAAYNLDRNAREEAFTPRAVRSLDLSKFPGVADNIRLWDWEPFRDNITQLQALRPYYSFSDVNMDRYQVGGRTQQVLIAARSLETGLLPDNAQTWVNLNLEYTHGYGAVAALVNSATPDGAPEMALENAPPQTDVPAFKITRPEIYFGPETDHPVFVDSDQQEFDYPKGDDNAYTTYSGSAGIPVGSSFMRVVAAVARGDWNILLTRYLTRDSKLLLHRQITDRAQRLAPFLTLDPDPYLVIDDSGRLFWMLDAYTETDRYPYSQPVALGDEQPNYIRNSVKITVDAYNGTVHFYVFDEKDPLLAAYRRLFPGLFEPAAAMPADLERHIRYPETIFDAQAAIYSTFHMRDPQVFYNKEDQWDVAKQVVSQEETRYTDPYYAMVPLPGEDKAEFALMLPFTSHNRDNLIAWIAARCDPEHYGEILFYRLPKEQLVYGPLQVQSLVDQDPDISKDLSLWNQQGSRVVRGSTLVLPVDGTFLYVEPIYIQSTQARMPELRKVVLAVGDRLVYADSLPEALRELARAPAPGEEAVAQAEETAAEAAPAAAAQSPTSSGLVESLRDHLSRYRLLTSQGKLDQAGRELQALESELDAAGKPR